MTAIDELVRVLEELRRAGTTVMELARAGRPYEPWTLYPDDSGIFDRTTRCQFYYHSHAGATHEHGHFHTVRLFDDHTVHVIAISMAETGWPQALFTVNLWAIGDADDTPANLKRYARRFTVRSSAGDFRVVAFINLMFRAFLPEIEWLQEEKERTLQAYRAAHPGRNPFEDRSLEILSRVEIHFTPRDRRVVPLQPAGASAIEPT